MFRYATIGTPVEISDSVIAVQLTLILAIGLGGIWFFNREDAASVDKL